MSEKVNALVKAATKGVKKYLKTPEAKHLFGDNTKVIITDEGAGLVAYNAHEHKETYVHFLTSEVK